MNEAKFPQDYDVEEYVAEHLPNMTLDSNAEASLRADHALRKGGVGGMLADVANEIKSYTPESVHKDIERSIGGIAAALTGTMPNTPWVVQEYLVDLVKAEDGSPYLKEFTRAHENIVTQYWDAVNG